MVWSLRKRRLGYRTAQFWWRIIRELFEQPIGLNKYGYLRWGAKEHSVCWYGIAIIREDLIGNAPAHADDVDFNTHDESMYNTPLCYTGTFRFSFRQLLREGGLSAMEKRNQEKRRSVRRNRRVGWLLQLPDGFKI